MSISESKSSSTSHSASTSSASSASRASSSSTTSTSSSSKVGQDRSSSSTDAQQGAQVDSSSISSEARAGELSASSSSSVNFGAWDSPAAEGSNKAAESTSVDNLGSKTLRQGMKSDEVKALQERLKANGADIKVDGIFGKQTLRAVKDFQKSQGIGVDGLVGKDTRKAFEGLNSAQADSKDGGQGDAPVGAEEANKVAEAAAIQAKSEGAGSVDGAQAGASEAGAAEKTSSVPGTDDTSWTDKLPKGLKPHAQAFIDAGKKYGIDPRFLAAISSQETGGGTSSALRNKNNAMGIMSGKRLKSFGSVADSINAQARSLTRDGGYYTGKDTIAKIGGTYAPIGAANDPNGLNKHWVPNITKFYEGLGGDASGQVKGF